MGIQGQMQDFILQAHIHLLICRHQGERVHLGQNFYSCKGHYVYWCPSWSWLRPGQDIVAPLQAFSPTTGDSTSLGTLVLYTGHLAHIKLPCDGSTHGV